MAKVLNMISVAILSVQTCSCGALVKTSLHDKEQPLICLTYFKLFIHELIIQYPVLYKLIIHELIIQYPVLNKSRACLFIPAREHFIMQ